MGKPSLSDQREMLLDICADLNSCSAGADHGWVIWLMVIYCVLIVLWGAVERLAPPKRLLVALRMRGRGDRPYDWARN